MMVSATDKRLARRDARRAEIVDAAAELFFSEGYGRTTMDRVLERVGGSKRTLYLLFPTKDVLFTEIVRRVSDDVLTALTPEFGVEDDVGDALFAMAMAYAKVLLSPGGVALYRAVIAEASHFPDLAKAFFENGPGRANAHLAAYLRRRTSNGDLAIDDPDLAASHFLSTVRGDLHLRHVLGVGTYDDEELERSVRAVTAAFVAAYGIAEGCREGSVATQSPASPSPAVRRSRSNRIV